MVKLSILSYKGNSNSRFYPHSGYLGLTPVKVEGGQYHPFRPVVLHSGSSYFSTVVRTALDEDKKPLQASSVQVSVSCIECRLGRVGIVHSNVLVEYSQTLWSKSASVEYDELGDGDFPFKIIIPIKTLGHSYLNFQDYRVLWRVEAGALLYSTLLNLSDADLPQSLIMLPFSGSALANINLMTSLLSAMMPTSPVGTIFHRRPECSLPPSLVPLLSNISSCNQIILSDHST